MVNFISNKDIMQEILNYDIILIGCNTLNKMGNGFQKRIALTYPYVEKVLKETPYGDKRKLGTVKVIPGNPIFCLLFINSGRYRPDIQKDYLDYNALKKCLSLIAKNFKDKTIATTLIGGSQYDGDGDKEKIIGIINDTLKDNNIDIYTDEQEEWYRKMKKEWLDIVNYDITPANQRQEKLKEHYWHLFKGDSIPMPEELKKMRLKDIKKILKEEKLN